MDIVALVATLVFICTSLWSSNTYSDACPKQIRTWIVLTFITFYGMQLMVLYYFRTKNRRLSLYLWVVTSFVVLPCMLLLNLWGNLLIEEMDNNQECIYNGYAQTFQMLYLIATYCVIFVYLIFLVTVKETMKRFYVQIERPEDQRIPRGIEENTAVFVGRSCKDIERALSYSLYLLNDGRIGSRQEREFLQRERTQIMYERLSSTIKTFVFNAPSQNTDEDDTKPSFDDEAPSP